MADELQIAIKVDPAGSVPAISAVEDALAKAEARAKAFGALGPTFTKIAEHMRAMAAETARARQAVDNLSSGFKAVADHMRVDLLKNVSNAFGGLTQAIQREVDMLEKIHGPARQVEEDLQTLEMLNRKGAISAKEHAEQLAKLGRSPVNAVSLPGAPKASGGGIGASAEIVDNMKGSLVGMLGPAALAASAIGSIGAAFSYWEQHEMMIGRSTNALLKFYDTAEQARNALGEQQKLADDLRIGLDHAVDAYGAVREATQAMYLTSKQQVDVTRNLSEALIVDGKSADDVAGIMGRVQVAMDLNTLSSRDYLAILRESPDVGEMMAESIGKTAKQMMEMAKAGKINGTVLEEMVVGMSRTATSHAKFQQRVITDADNVRSVMLQQGQQIRTAFGWVEDAQDAARISADEWSQQTVNGLRKQMDEMNAYRRGLDDTLAAFSALTNVIGRLGTALNDPWGSTTQFERTMKAAINLTTPVADAKAQLHDLDEAWKTTVGHTARNAIEYRKARKALTDTISGEVSIDYYKQQLDSIIGPTKAYTGALGALNALQANHTISTHQYAEALGKIHSPLVHLDQDIRNVTERYKEMAAAQLAASHGGMGGAAAVGLTGHGFSQVDRDAAAGNALMDRGEASFEKQQAALEAKGRLSDQAGNELMNPRDIDVAAEKFAHLHGVTKDIAKTITGIESGITGLAGSFSDALVDAANGADVSWSKFGIDALVTFEKLIAKALILEAIGGTGGGVAGAGSGLLGVLFGGNHATGGSYTAPNTGGGPDSIPVAFRMNPGETATFTNPGQVGPGAQAQQSGSGPPPVVHVHLQGDSRDLAAAMSSGSLDTHIIQAIRRNPGAVRALLSK